MSHAQAYIQQESVSDEALMARSRDGDEQAFALLVHRYEAPLYGYLRRMLQSGADAEDVFQETFLRIFCHRRRFRPEGRFKPWAYRIATNLARDRLRARKRRGEQSLETTTLPGVGAAAYGNPVAGATARPDEAASTSETAQRLESALARLPEKQRAVFLMARYNGMAYGDIARTLRIPVGTVKSRMNKATLFLLRCLEQDGP